MIEWGEVYKRNYEAKAFWDVHWIRCAKDLIHSAKLIEPEVVRLWESYRAHLKDKNKPISPDHYQGPYFMLMAFAVENLFKAAIIRKKSCEYLRTFKQKNEFPKQLKEHDLVKLANMAKFDFTIEDEDLLRRLSRSAIWYGRYPIPLNYRQTSGSEIFSDGEKHPVSWFGGNDLERLNQLIEEIKQQLDMN